MSAAKTLSERPFLRNVLGGFVLFFAGTFVGGYVVWSQTKSTVPTNDFSAFPIGTKSAPVFEGVDDLGSVDRGFDRGAIPAGTKSPIVFEPKDADDPFGSNDSPN